MKHILILFFLSTLFLNAQFDSTRVKPAKIRVYNSFLSTKYEIGDNSAKEKEVINHLEKYSPRGYYDYRKGKANNTTGLVFVLIGGGLVLGTIKGVSEGKSTSLGLAASGYFMMASGLIIDLVGNSKKEKAIDFYNREYGY